MDTKLKLIRILEIIRETDEGSPLTAAQIGKKLKAYGIDAERKSICRDIRALIEAGFDIVNCEDNKRGWYLAGRTFEDWELKILIDAVSSAKFLADGDKVKTVSKLIGLSSPAGQKMLRQNSMAIRSANGKGNAKYNIDAVLTAIRQKRKIRFQYLATDEDLKERLRRGGLFYTVSPYALIWQDERYYLICNYDKYYDLSYYRLDRMKNMEVLNEPIRDAEELLGSNADLQIREYVESTLYRYGGELTCLRLFCQNGMQDEMLDSFGNFAFQKADGGFFATVSVRDGDGLIYWLMQHGPHVKVLSPEHIRQKLIDALRTSLNQYT